MSKVHDRMRQKPTMQYVENASMLSEPIYFVAIRPPFWDNKSIYPDIHPDDMSMAFYRTTKSRDSWADRCHKDGYRVVIGEFIPAQLIRVAGQEYAKQPKDSNVIGEGILG